MVDKNTNHQQRNYVFDLLKIILTFLVVNIHIRNVFHGRVNFLERYGYFSVPIFMTLSFFLMSKYFFQIKLSFSTVLMRIKRLFFPLVFWSAIGFLLKPNLINFKNVLLQLMTGKVVNTPIYYLDLLILFTLIFWLITYIPPKFRVPLYFVIIIVAFVLEYTGINTHYFNLTVVQVRKSYGQIVELIKYAALGMIFAKLVNQNNKRIILFSFTGLTLFLLLTFNFPQPWGYNYSGLKLFFGTIFIFSSLLLVGQINFSSIISKFINVFGGYSFGVYLFHIMLLEAFLTLFPDIRYLNASSPFIFLFIYTVVCYVFCFLFDLLTFKKFSFLIK